ncbi:MAG: hypothetical protein LBI77_01710 [Puniceicoccales bacterium]|jgi:hypothetical protein|nr:hypothetical protein [Puniceicoccales bacterium]
MNTNAENEILYFLITDCTSNVFEKIKFPIEKVFVVGKNNLRNKNHKKREKTTTYIFIQENDTNLITEKIHKSIQNLRKEKIILMNRNLYNTFNNKQEIYGHFLKKYKNIFLIDLENNEDNEENFVEIFPEETPITLLDKTHKFEDNE